MWKKYIYVFQKLQMKRPFGDSFFNGKITISQADNKQSKFLESI